MAKQSAEPMKLYRLFHRVLGEERYMAADSAQEACQLAGWLIGDVWIREETKGIHATVWRNITRKVNDANL